MIVRKLTELQHITLLAYMEYIECEMSKNLLQAFTDPISFFSFNLISEPIKYLW